MSGISEKLKSAAFTAALQKALDYLEKDPEANALKVMDMVDKFTPDGWYVSQRAAVRTALETKSNWYRLMMSIFRLDPGVRRAFLQNFLVNASLVGSGVQEDTARREVWEEVGLHITDLRFYKSQPWVFTDTLLMGFFVRLEGSSQVHLQLEELSVGKWFRREALPTDHSGISLTGEMIETFRRGEDPFSREKI